MAKVNSQDPRKKAVVAALKAKTGATKVTQVTELETGSFRGNCMKQSKPSRKFEQLGLVEVSKAECGLNTVDNVATA